MQTPGEYLKKERDLRGLSIAEVAADLNLAKRVIKALEDDDYSNLPHRVYVKGFIKSYCAYVGLDETDAVLRYESYIEDLEQKAREQAGIKKERASGKPDTYDYLQGSGMGNKGVSMSGKRVSNTWLIAGFVAVGCIVIILYFLLLVPDESRLVVESDKVVGAVVGVAVDDGAKKSKAQPEQLSKAQPEQPSKVRPQQEVKQAKGAASVEVKKQASPEVPKPDVDVKKSALNKNKKTDQVKNTSAGGADKAGKAAATKALRHELQASAKADVWMKVRVDEDEPFEVLMNEGDRVSWKAAKVFF